MILNTTQKKDIEYKIIFYFYLFIYLLNSLFKKETHAYALVIFLADLPEKKRRTLMKKHRLSGRA